MIFFDWYSTEFTLFNYENELITEIVAGMIEFQIFVMVKFDNGKS